MREYISKVSSQSGQGRSCQTAGLRPVPAYRQLLSEPAWWLDCWFSCRCTYSNTQLVADRGPHSIAVECRGRMTTKAGFEHWYGLCIPYGHIVKNSCRP